MFDEALAKLVTTLRKATQEEVERAFEELEQRQAAGEKLDLAQVLLEQGVLDEGTAARLRKHAVREHGPHIPGYQIVEPLGGGGMGRVYAAKQIELDRLVALKVLAPDLMRDEEARARFLREAKAAGRLDHPNIVKAYDVSVGEPEGAVPPYIAMEFVRGETLHSLLERTKRISERLTLKIASAVAAALDHAYRQGLVHRDVKPDNIMLTSQGEVKLCDLGLAKRIGHDQTLTHSGMTHGTPHFMSPEQAQGRRELDIRSDLYSLGCTMFRAAVGRPPYVADTALELLMAHVEKATPSAKALRPELSIHFDRIVQRLMAKLPEERYQYPAHLQTDLELLLAGEAPRMDWGVPFRQSPAASDSRGDLPRVDRKRDADARTDNAEVSPRDHLEGRGKEAVITPPSGPVESLGFLDESASGTDSGHARTALEVDELKTSAAKPPGTKKKKKKKKKRTTTSAGTATPSRGGNETRKRKGSKRKRKGSTRKPGDNIRVQGGLGAVAARLRRWITSLRCWLGKRFWPIAYASTFVVVAALGFWISTLLVEPEEAPEGNGAPTVGPENGQEATVTREQQWRAEADQRRTLLEAAQAAEEAERQATEARYKEVSEQAREALGDTD